MNEKTATATPPAAPPPAAAEVAEPTVIKPVRLHKPISAHGDLLKELTLREPTGMDIINCGNPVKLDFSKTPPEVTFDERKMAAMICTLASIPTSSVGKMHPKDWNTVAWVVAGFFIPDMEQLW